MAKFIKDPTKEYDFINIDLITNIYITEYEKEEVYIKFDDNNLISLEFETNERAIEFINEVVGVK